MVGIRKREPFEMFAGSFGEQPAKALPFFTIKGIGIAIFCHLKDVFYFADHRAKSDIFLRKNGKLQQI